MMKPLILLFFAVALLPAQLRINYDLSAAPEALAIYTINDPGFAEGAMRDFRVRAGDPDLSRILPLVLRIKNVGRLKIGYLSVRYVYTLPDGDHAGNITYERNPHMGDQFEPGQEIVLHPAMDAIGHHVTASNSRMVDQLVNLMANSSQIAISIDAVTWEDGTIVGRDLGGIANKYRSQRQAIEAAYAEASGRAHRSAADEFTYRRALDYAKGDAAALKGMLDKFAPLKGESE